MDKKTIVLNILPYLSAIKDEEKIIVYQLATDGIGTLSLFQNYFSTNTIWLIIDTKGIISEKFEDVILYKNFKDVDLSHNLLKKSTYMISELCTNETLNLCQNYYFKNFILLFRLRDADYMFPDRLRIKYHSCYKKLNYFILTKDTPSNFTETLSTSGSTTITELDEAYIGNILLLENESILKKYIIRLLNSNKKDTFYYDIKLSLDFLIQKLAFLIDNLS